MGFICGIRSNYWRTMSCSKKHFFHILTRPRSALGNAALSTRACAVGSFLNSTQADANMYTYSFAAGMAVHIHVYVFVYCIHILMRTLQHCADLYRCLTVSILVAYILLNNMVIKQFAITHHLILLY